MLFFNLADFYIMETSLNPQPNNIVRQLGYSRSAGLYNSSDLTLRTSEGDLVTISSSKQLAYSESGKKTHFESGEIVEEFSTKALAASQYSLSVQGDLNEDELAAIEMLVGKLTPMAQTFFNQSGFDAGKAVEAMTESFGIIDQVSLKLNKTEVNTTSTQLYSKISEEEMKNLKEAVEEDLSDIKGSNIRNLTELLSSVIGAVFLKAEKEFTEDDQFLDSLNSVTRFFHSQFIPLLEPLSGKINGLLPEDIEPALPIVKEPIIKIDPFPLSL